MYDNALLEVTRSIAWATWSNAGIAFIIGTIAIISLCRTIKHFKATNRPYIGSRFKKIEIHKSEALVIHSELKNFGNLPATNVKLKWNLLIDSKIVATESLADDNEEGPVIPPKEEYPFFETLFRNEIENILSPTKKIELVNYITYQTVNNIKYRTIERYKKHPSCTDFIESSKTWK